MTSFDDREKAQENRHAYDQESLFKARAKAARLFGQWCAEHIGLEEPAAYAAELVSLAASGKEGPELVKKALADAEARAKTLQPELLAEKYERCLQEAKEAIAKS